MLEAKSLITDEPPVSTRRDLSTYSWLKIRVDSISDLNEGNNDLDDHPLGNSWLTLIIVKVSKYPANCYIVVISSYMARTFLYSLFFRKYLSQYAY